MRAHTIFGLALVVLGACGPQGTDGASSANVTGANGGATSCTSAEAGASMSISNLMEYKGTAFETALRPVPIANAAVSLSLAFCDDQTLGEPSPAEPARQYQTDDQGGFWFNYTLKVPAGRSPCMQVQLNVPSADAEGNALYGANTTFTARYDTLDCGQDQPNRNADTYHYYVENGSFWTNTAADVSP
jgi:hypothetical protein